MTRFVYSGLLWVTLLVSVGALAHPGEAQKLGYLDQQIAEYPDQPANYIKRGAVYRHLGLLERAQQDFNRASVLGDSVNVQYEQGRLYVRQGRERDAIAAFSLYLAHFPTSSQSWEQRAKAYQRIGDYQAALADYHQVIQLTPALNPGHFLAIAQLQGLANIGITQRLATLDDGLAAIGNNIALQKQAIELALEGGLLAEAIKRHTAIKTLTGATPSWNVEMARLQQLSGDAVAAESYLQQAESQLSVGKATPASKRTWEQIRLLRE